MEDEEGGAIGQVERCTGTDQRGYEKMRSRDIRSLRFEVRGSRFKIEDLVLNEGRRRGKELFKIEVVIEIKVESRSRIKIQYQNSPSCELAVLKSRAFGSQHIIKPILLFVYCWIQDFVAKCSGGTI